MGEDGWHSQITKDGRGRNNDGDRFDGGDHRNALLVEKIAKEESASIP